MQFDIAESSFDEGIGMHYDFRSFSPAKLARKKAYSCPTLTSTKLTDEEFHDALSSPESFVELGKRLRAEGRI